MPEIKNNFTQGRMNKDLDERLIPNGEYRHAMNVQVSTSEGSDVGAVQNILGNKSIEALVPNNFKCIGSIADEKTNKIYWFVTTVSVVNPNDPKIDAILEYETGKLAIPVIVDNKADTASAVLKFTKNIITGINIVDDMLLWTDNVNEPRKININRCKAGTDGSSNNLSTIPHTKLVVDDIIATNEFTTIASLDIVNLDTITLNDASELNEGMTLVSIGGVDQTGITITSIATNDVTLSSSVDVVNLDEVIFSSPIDITEDHITVIKKKPTIAPTIKINTNIDIPKPTLFEKTLGRFACRYKYEDGEYSAFGPFTNVVFDPKYTEGYDADTAFSVKEPYNVAMLNSVESIELTDFVPTDIPKDVVQIDILYKQEDSPNVYSVANIKKDDSAWTADGSNQQTSFISGNKGKYIVESENIYAVVPQNQALRPWDNVPRRALAQEITGNRAVYGNYIQNYNLIDADRDAVTPTLTIDYGLRNNIDDFASGGLPSIKSQRNYQLGVVFGDKYGRETPVYTSTNAAVKIPWLDDRFGKSASNSLQLKTNLTSSVPEWSNYYKFFVKETSGEYYNLVMDKAYNPTSDTEDDVEQKHIWVSFPSSDRNKISEETYLILKKRVGVGEGQVQYENRFKIIDVKNEAPDAIKYKFYSLGAVDNSTGILHNDTTGIMTDDTRRIDVETDRIDVNKDHWLDDIMAGADLLQGSVYDAEVESIYISWQLISGGIIETSKRYKVVQVNTATPGLYKIKLAEKILQKDALLAHDSSNLADGGDLHADLVFRVERKQLKDTDEFSGRFFVKIVSDATTSLNIEQDGTNDLLDGLVTTAQQDMYWWFDTQDTSNTDEWVDGIINADFLGTATNAASVLHGLGGNITETQEKWAVLETFSKTDTNNGKFFIDNMYFCAGQNSGEGYAKDAGDIVRGTTNKYQAITWSGWVNVAHEPPPTGNMHLVWGFNNALGYRWWPVDYTVHPTLSNYNFFLADSFKPNPSIINEDETKAVNGMEGIIVTGDEHTKDDADGIRTWRKEGPLATLDNTENLTYEFDDTYGEEGETGRYFIHLSFMAPGDDLVPHPMDITNAKLKGPESLGTHLQGIWGGGVFMKSDGSAFVTNMHQYTLTSGAFPPSFQGDRVIELEGNYNNNTSNISWQQVTFPGPGGPSYQGAGTAPWTALSASPGPNVGQGYNPAYADLHENQWNPAYPASRDPFFHIRNFISNIHVGAKFKFSADTSNTVYNILSVKIKKLYNHTPWRRRKIYTDKLLDSVSTTVTPTDWYYAGDSVEEAAVKWANEMNVATNLSTAPDNGTTGTDTVADDLQNKIIDFGRANNRRVCYIIEVDKDPSASTSYNPIGSTAALDADDGTKLQFIEADARNFASGESSKPAVWETEPKKSADLDIYYETGNIIPTEITDTSREIFAPVGCRVEFIGLPTARDGATNITEDIYLTSWDKDLPNAFVVDAVGGNSGFNTYSDSNGGTLVDYEDTKLRFYRKDGSYTTAIINGVAVSGTPVYINKFEIKSIVDPDLEVGLSWNNCFSFGNGIESDRIRDGYNEAQISNGAKASSTTEEPYQEEHRKHGLIYSGLYNSNSGVNDLNQFIMADKITKDLNPTFGSIQKLFQRRASLVTFCEDRVISILSNRDALYNADGNPQLISSSAVLGDATPFVGDYGISRNPESFAKESYRAYFADKQRGAILRLSKDGLTPISDLGMHDWFRDNLTTAGFLIGTYDEYKKDYNLTLTEPLADNLLINTTEGEEVTETANNAELILNGAINTGTPFLMPTVIAPEDDYPTAPYDVNASSFWMDIDDEELMSETTTVNWPAIDAGTLQGVVTEVVTPAVSFVAPVFSNTPVDMMNFDFTTKVYADNPFAEETYNTSDFAGTPAARIDRRVATSVNPSSGDFNCSHWGGTPLLHHELSVPNEGHGYSLPYTQAGGLTGHAFSRRSRGNVFYNPQNSGDGGGDGDGDYQVGVVFWHTHAGTSVNTPVGGTNYGCRYSLGTGGGDSDTVDWTTPTHGSSHRANMTYLAFPGDNGVAYDPNFDVSGTGGMYNGTDVITTSGTNNTYSTAKQNTIFNGEEIELEFEVLTPSPTQTANTNWGDGLGWTAISGFKAVLWDPDENNGAGGVVPSDKLTGTWPMEAFGANGVDNPVFQSGTNSNNGLQQGSTGAFGFTDETYLRGYDDDPVTKFPLLPRNGTTKKHRCYWKFRDDSGGITSQASNDPDQWAESILVNNLQIRLVFYQPTASGGHVQHVIKNLKVRKVWRLVTPETTAALPITTTIGVPMAPPVDIPAWTQVTHSVISGWMSNSPGVDLHTLASNTYYPTDTGSGTLVPYSVANANPANPPTSSDYLIPPNFDLQNGVYLDNDGDGNPDTIPDLSSTVSDGTHTTNDSFYIDSTGNIDGKAYITQDLGTTPFVADNWYLVDIYYQPSLSGTANPAQGTIGVYGVVNSAATAGGSNITTTDGHVGDRYVSSSSPTMIKSMQLVPTMKTANQYGSGNAAPMVVTFSGYFGGEHVLRAIFKVHPDSYINGNNADGPGGGGLTYLDTLKLEFTDFIGQIDKIVVLNISENSTGGTAANWNIPTTSLNQGTGNNSFHTPLLYWLDNKFNWGRIVLDHPNQSLAAVNAHSDDILYQDGPFDNTSAVGATTHAGYEFKFTISENTNVPGVQYAGWGVGGYLNSYITSDFGNSNDFEGFYITGVDTAGDYVARVNFDGTGGTDNQGNTLPLSLKLDGVDHGTITSYSGAGLDTTDASRANRVAFVPDDSGVGFMGAINQISLIDLTNFFTGGTSNAWVFTGFDTTYYNYITFDVDDQNIQFIEAPENFTGSNDPVQMEQFIPQIIGNGEYYRVRFNYSNIAAGTLNGYYFNTAGEGFRLGSISSSGQYDQVHQIGEATAEIGELRNTFVIFVETGLVGTVEDPGTLSNLEMLREYPMYAPKTLTYNEMVKGWVSFKSFILEHGNSVAKKYFTMKNGKLYEHHADLDDNRNTFYGVDEESSLTAVLNESPSSIKIFNTLNYEGSQSKILQYDTNHIETLKPYNKIGKAGWYVDTIKTDKQLGTLSEFIEKEGKWFNYIRGDINDIKTADFSFQGLGTVASTSGN